MNMETKEVKLYVQAHKWIWQKEYTVSYETFQIQSTSDRFVKVLSVITISVPIPNFDVKQLQLAEVEQLQETIQTERANSYARITAIEEKIQSLLCIEQGE
jgi:hypothetical protein